MIRRIAHLFAELRRRRVFKAGALYLAAGWVILQVATTITPIARLPAWIPTFVLVLVILGVPILLVFAWVYDVTPGGVALTSNKAVYPVDSEAVSIAVLPFVNRSADPDDEYFSDGLADELIGLLAKIKGLRVSARASSFHFKGKQLPLAEVGGMLNVAALLDGSVRRAGGRVRISVQLVQVADGYSLWSEQYDRTLEDIFAVQDDIAHAVVKELRATILGEDDSGASGRAKVEVDRAGKGRSSNPDAHRLYLLARHYMDQLSREGTAKAITHLTEALEREPTFALAWVELSVAYLREVGFTLIPADEGYARARDAVARSLELEPTLADGHAQVASIKIFHDWDWAGAEAALSRAAHAAPGSASILRLSGVLAAVLGNPDEAIAIYRRALMQDPLSAAAYHSLGLALHAVADTDGAEEAFLKALDLAPHRIATHAHLAFIAYDRHQFHNAMRLAEREPEAGYRLWALAIIHRAQDSVAADAALRELIEKHANGWALQIAEVYTADGHVDAAFEWLDRAYATRDPGLVQVKINPHLRDLHRDPRWNAFLQKMRLEQGAGSRNVRHECHFHEGLCSKSNYERYTGMRSIIRCAA